MVVFGRSRAFCEQSFAVVDRARHTRLSRTETETQGPLRLEVSPEILTREGLGPSFWNLQTSSAPITRQISTEIGALIATLPGEEIIQWLEETLKRAP